jgi:hypothetical protein
MFLLQNLNYRKWLVNLLIFNLSVLGLINHKLMFSQRCYFHRRESMTVIGHEDSKMAANFYFSLLVPGPECVIFT